MTFRYPINSQLVPLSMNIYEMFWMVEMTLNTAFWFLGVTVAISVSMDTADLLHTITTLRSAYFVGVMRTKSEFEV